MPTHEAEAIVLRQYSLSEYDRIVVFVTREHGRVRAVARGVKKPKSYLAGCLEPLNHVRIEFYIREGRDLAQVRQAEIIHSYLGKSPSLEQIYTYTYFAELINEIVQDNNPNFALFRLFLASLDVGERRSVGLALVRYFEIWCLKLNGLIANYDYCSNCGKCVKDEEFFAWIETGQVRCCSCAHERGIRVRAAAAAALQAMIEVSPERFVSRPFPEAAAVDLERLTQRLLALHLEKQLKSYAMLREALQSK